MASQERKKVLARWIGIRAVMVIWDILAVNLSYYGALILRYFVNNEMLAKAGAHVEAFWRFAPFYTVICIVIFACFKLYSGIWKYAALSDLNRVLSASLLSSAIYTAATIIFVHRMPISVYVIGALIQLMLTVGSRFAVRFIQEEINHTRRGRRGASMNVLLVGIGESAQIIRRKIERDPESASRIVCIYSSRLAHDLGTLDGVPVFSDLADFAENVSKYRVECVILADSLMPQEERDEIHARCEALKIGVQDFSGYFGNSSGMMSFKRLMEFTSGPVTIDIDGTRTSYPNAEEALMGVHGAYEIRSVRAEECKLVVALKERKYVMNDLEEQWVKESPEPVSFF